MCGYMVNLSLTGLMIKASLMKAVPSIERSDSQVMCVVHIL